MADPRQKSLDREELYLTRHIPLWTAPGWLEAERWRRVVDNQPVAAICEDALLRDLQGTQWEIRAKNPRQEDSLADDIELYTLVLNPEGQAGLSGFDNWVVQMGEDLLRIPIGGNSEIVRYPDGMGPFDQPHSKGHIYKIVYIDGATLSPVYDPQFIMQQRLKSNLFQSVYFRRHEIMRLVMRSRTEMLRWGYGMSPPEKIYLAIASLYRGDAYYANLLLDTPEAGLLDLADMSQQSAREWLQSFRELMTGIDPFKIPVLYEHEKEVRYISFGRPPTELMFDSITLKYSQIVHAGYGLTLTDTGLGDPQKTLAGSIRDERRSRRSGFGTIREKFKTAIDSDILPSYLEFHWIENDEEARVQKGRSFLLFVQSLKAAKEARFISALEGQKQLVKEGYFDIELEEPEEPITSPLSLPPGPAGPGENQQITSLIERVPVEEGGHGDLTGKAILSMMRRASLELGDERISAVPKDSDYYDQLASIIRAAFAGIMNRMERPRLLKLIKTATRPMFPVVHQALVELSDLETPVWLGERLRSWFGEESEFDDLAEIMKSNGEVLDSLDELLDREDWWRFDPATARAIALILKLAYSEGATLAIQEIQQFLYTEGLRDSPYLIGLNFELKNPHILTELEARAAQLVRRIDDGTRYYLKRIIVSGVDEGLASPSIANLIREGYRVEEILKEAGYVNQVIGRVIDEVRQMSEYRTNSIVNTEINRAETAGRAGEWGQMGLTRKAWKHTGPWDVCYLCLANIELGFVPIDTLYDSVFGPADTPGPPGHPGVCHCHLEFDEEELLNKAETLQIWTGE